MLLFGSFANTATAAAIRPSSAFIPRLIWRVFECHLWRIPDMSRGGLIPVQSRGNDAMMPVDHVGLIIVANEEERLAPASLRMIPDLLHSFSIDVLLRDDKMI